MKKTALLSLLLLSIPSVAVARIAPVPSAPVPVIERVQPRSQYRPPQLMALGRKQVESRFAADVLSLEITRGIGIVINFGSLGDVVQGVQISDPSTLVYKQMGAGAVFIKPIQKLNFPGNLSATNGRNLLTIVMRSGSIYQFDLAIKSASVNYSGIDIVPDGTLTPAKLPPAVPNIPTTTAQAPQSSSTAPLVGELTPEVSIIGVPPASSATESEPDPQPQTVEPPPPTAKSEVVVKAPTPDPSEITEPQSKSQKTKEAQKKQEPAKDIPVEKLTSAKEVTPSVAEVRPPKSQSHTAVVPSSPVELSHAIARGLPVALSKRQIGRYSYTYYKSQSAIKALRRGRAKTLNDAARISRSKLSVLTQLVKWGTKP